VTLGHGVQTVDGERIQQGLAQRIAAICAQRLFMGARHMFVSRQIEKQIEANGCSLKGGMGARIGRHYLVPRGAGAR